MARFRLIKIQDLQEGDRVLSGSKLYHLDQILKSGSKYHLIVFEEEGNALTHWIYSEHDEVIIVAEQEQRLKNGQQR
jgi:hypothetical protein